MFFFALLLFSVHVIINLTNQMKQTGGFKMTTNKNVLTDRKEMAQALNFGKYKVLTYNVDTEKGSTAKVEQQTRQYGIRQRPGTLHRGKITADDGIFYLLNHSTIMKKTFNVYDWLETAENASSPVIYEGDEVAILVYSEDLDVASVRLVKALKPRPEFSTSLVFEDLY